MTSVFRRDLSGATQAIALAQERAATAGVQLRVPPPVPTTCCGRGCAGCVWESYFDAVELWLRNASQRTV
jgi:hypothetical protein